MSEIVAILAFANPRNDLPSLAKERYDIYKALNGLRSKLTIYSLSDHARFKDVVNGFRLFPDCSGYILHFGLHTSNDVLLLEDDAGKGKAISAKNLAAYLANTPELRLVFLNGCTNYAQAKKLQEARVPAVIVTNQAIDDVLAAEFAREFYEELAGQSSIEQAFNKAKATLESDGKGNARELLSPRAEKDKEDIGLPWELYGTAEGKAWSLREALQGTAKASHPPLAFDTNPFKGMSAFQEEDAPRFYGRDEDTKAVIERIEKQPFVALVGNSGTGKSSLVFAGVVHELKANQADTWIILDCKPGYEPLNNLAGPLLGAWLDEYGVIRRRKSFLSDLQAGDISISEVAKRISEKNDHKRVLLIIDQYEELYTLTSSEASTKQDKSLQATYQNGLLAAVSAQPAEPFLTILITLRTDFLPHAYENAAFGELFKKGAYPLFSMEDEEKVRAAIELPDKEGEPRVLLESGLSERIIGDAGGELTLLQFAMEQLWVKDIEEKGHRQLTHDTYEEMEGVQGAIQRHADAVYDDLGEAEQEQAKHVLMQLVHLGEGVEDTRRVVLMRNLESYRSVIAKLTDARLVITGADKPEGEKEQREEQGEVEIIHEALIRNWQLLRGWIDDNREFLRWQRSVQQRMKAWENHAHAPSELLQGTSLEIAEEKLKESGHLLEKESPEREYIQKSQAERERIAREKKREQAEKGRLQTRQRQTLLIGLVAVSVLAVLLSWVAINLRQQNQEVQRRSIETTLQRIQVRSDSYSEQVKRNGNYSGGSQRRNKRLTFESMNQGSKRTKAMLLSCGEIRANDSKLRSAFSAPKAPTNLLLQLDHPQITLSLVIVKGYALIMDKPQDVSFSVFETKEQILSRSSLRFAFAFRRGMGIRVEPLSSGKDKIIETLKLEDLLMGQVTRLTGVPA